MLIVRLSLGLTEVVMSHLYKWYTVKTHFPDLHFGCVKSSFHLSLQVLLCDVLQMSLNIEWSIRGRQMKRMQFEHSIAVIWAVPFGVQSFWIGFYFIFWCDLSVGLKKIRLVVTKAGSESKPQHFSAFIGRFFPFCFLGKIITLQVV